jgi:cell division protein FtsX
MQSSPFEKAILGGFFILVGLVMAILHKQVKEFHEDLFPEFLRRFLWRGVPLTVMIILFGVLFVLGGLTLLLISIVQQ